MDISLQKSLISFAKSVFERIITESIDLYTMEAMDMEEKPKRRWHHGKVLTYYVVLTKNGGCRVSDQHVLGSNPRRD